MKANPPSPDGGGHEMKGAKQQNPNTKVLLNRASYQGDEIGTLRKGLMKFEELDEKSKRIEPNRRKSTKIELYRTRGGGCRRRRRKLQEPTLLRQGFGRAGIQERKDEGRIMNDETLRKASRPDSSAGTFLWKSYGQNDFKEKGITFIGTR